MRRFEYGRALCRQYIKELEWFYSPPSIHSTARNRSIGATTFCFDLLCAHVPWLITSQHKWILISSFDCAVKTMKSIWRWDAFCDFIDLKAPSAPHANPYFSPTIQSIENAPLVEADVCDARYFITRWALFSCRLHLPVHPLDHLPFEDQHFLTRRSQPAAGFASAIVWHVGWTRLRRCVELRSWYSYHFPVDDSLAVEKSCWLPTQFVLLIH